VALPLERGKHLRWIDAGRQVRNVGADSQVRVVPRPALRVGQHEVRALMCVVCIGVSGHSFDQ
jgi:hypothetical protein